MKEKILVIDFYRVLKYVMFSLLFLDIALFFVIDALDICLFSIIYFIAVPFFLMEVRESIYKRGSLYYLSFLPLCVFYFLIYLFYEPEF